MAIKPWREIAKPHKNIGSLTELGRKLLAIRRKAIAKGLQLKSTDEILAEIRADRGN